MVQCSINGRFNKATMQMTFTYDCTPNFVHFTYLFTGKERDAESGLDYFGARYYGSNMGRFMSPDWASKPEAVPYSSLSDPQTLNLYSYMRNNPLGGTDPDGHCGQQQSGAGLDCTKLPNNPVTQVSPATKAQINNAVTATGQPSGTDTKGGSHEEAGISYTVNGTQPKLQRCLGRVKT